LFTNTDDQHRALATAYKKFSRDNDVSESKNQHLDRLFKNFARGWIMQKEGTLNAKTDEPFSLEQVIADTAQMRAMLQEFYKRYQA